MKSIVKTIVLTAVLLVPLSSQAKKADSRTRAKDAMKTATEFMMEKVSFRGGFVWNYLPDMSRRWGELEAKPTMAWVQSPGTPDVGNLLLDAYHATSDEYYYEQACKVASAIIWGQLECGGWNYMFDFAGEESLKDWYSTIGRNAWRLEEFQHYYGNATFDDSATTDCAKFLLRIYVEKYDPIFKPALDKAINFVLESQYPVGGWPQRYPLMYNHPFQGREDYSSFITLNDDVIPEATDFLLQCYQSLGMSGLKEPVLRAMYSVILLQQGKPYAGWADQYTVADLKPAHARSYEPCGINSGTTPAMVRQLMKYYRLTGDTRFLAGIPAALDYLESMALPESEVKRWGRPSRDPEAILLPRFVDPKTGKPQYVHREGSNIQNGRYFTNQDITGTIGHYSSATWVNVKALRRSYEELLRQPVEELVKDSPLAGKDLVPLDRYYYLSENSPKAGEKEAMQIVSELTPDGAWLTVLGNTSNPYAPYSDPVASHTDEYAKTNVGDIHDTSMYRNTDESILCISTKEYIRRMTLLMSFIGAE